MVKTDSLQRQPSLVEQMKAGINIPGIQQRLRGPDRLRLIANIDNAMKFIPAEGQTDLAEHIIAGVSQPHTRSWSGDAQAAAVTIFSRINFGRMDEQAIGSLRNRYLNTVYEHSLDYDNHEPAINLLQLGRILLPYMRDVDSFDGARGVMQHFGRMTREVLSTYTPPTAAEQLDELLQTFDALDQIKDAMGEKKRNPYYAERIVRRQIVYLSQRRTIQQIADDLHFVPSTIEKDRTWLIANGFVDKKPPGHDVSDRRAVVAEISDLDYDQIADTVGASIKSLRKDVRHLREQGHTIQPKKGGTRPSKELSANAAAVLPYAHLSRAEAAERTHLSFEQVRRARQELIREGFIDSKRPQRAWTAKDRKTTRGTVYQAQSASK